MPRLLPILLATLSLAGLFASPALGRPLVEVGIVDREDGQWLSPVRHRGQDWVVGTPGHRYAVRLTNTTGQRVLVVLSVDGVNAVTGQTAHPSQAGYVLGPWQSTQIQGWRKSLDRVAQFVFTDLPDSYAARTGRPDNVGVIGIAVFEEARPHFEPYPAPHRREAEKSAAPAAESSRDAAAQSIGTGHGAPEWSRVDQTQFARASRSPSQIRELRYDDCASLTARGIGWACSAQGDAGPHAFPGAFVPDPPYRR